MKAFTSHTIAGLIAVGLVFGINFAHASCRSTNEDILAIEATGNDGIVVAAYLAS